jgi:tRNA modification GTPase
MNENICAISTALGVGAISIIRATGPDVLEISNKIFKGKDLTKVDSHTINYGFIVDGEEVIDEVLVSVMKAPKTFTKEDMVEINSHGGISTTNKILELLLESGCRLAEPGEFTKKAFLNGRIDLVEAEGINDLIVSETESQRKFAMNRLNGNLSRLIKDMRKDIMELEGKLEVAFDYPDEIEDEEELTYAELKETMINIKNKLTKLVNSYRNSSIIKDGINVSIVGKPNVGKSSILNHLLDQDKAIVTDIAGTTRDIVEGTVSLNGIKLNLTDTAGIRKTDDLVESIGVKKSLDIISKSDLVLFVLNNNEELTKEELDLINNTDVNKIVFINKTDLESKIDFDLLKGINYIKGNTTAANGLDELKTRIVDMFNLEQINSSDFNYISNARELSLVKKAESVVTESINNLNATLPFEIVADDLRISYVTLGEIIGETYNEDIIDEIFSKFCVGK